MDDYTFIVLAKLKADRLRLEREERARQLSAPTSEWPSRRRHLVRTPRIEHYPHRHYWREQS